MDHPTCYIGLLKNLANGQISHHNHGEIESSGKLVDL